MMRSEEYHDFSGVPVVTLRYVHKDESKRDEQLAAINAVLAV